MKLTTLKTSVLSTIIVTSIVLSAGIAAAQTGTNASYIGAGVAAGITNGGRDNDAAVFGGNVQGRYAIPEQPVSIRGAVLFGGDATAIIPTVTYDVPIAQRSNMYIGAGYSFVTDENRNSQLGNRNAAVITLGAESEVHKNVVVYSDAKWAIDAYESGPADAVSIQAGVGYRF
ncbi:MAG: outer membrane beta-barrel protein [Calothrix sp. MO_167.B12]|nr:outer membrane beta-barrel protein [Calothrix sp. MO_167.B12]